MTNFKKHIIFLIITVLLVGTKFFSQLNKNQKITLVLDYARNTSHSSIFTAVAKNYFLENGIDLEIIDNSTQNTAKIIENKQYDLAISYQETISYANQQNANLVSIMTFVQKNPSCYAYRKDANINSTKELFTKNYAFYQSPIEEYLLNLSAKSSNTIFTGNKISVTQPDYLLNPKLNIQFGLEYAYWIPIIANSQKIETNCLNITDLTKINYYSPILITNKETLNEKRSQLTKVVRALEKAANFNRLNLIEGAQILAQNSKIDLVLAEQSLKIYNEYAFENAQFGIQKQIVWDQYMQILFEQGIIEKYNYEGIYENI